nr:bifunctional oligoribonuclease/PAP phosphatase NrnA [uncultured Holophaga sp.]
MTKSPIDPFAELLLRGERTLLTAHENPDPDAVGALLGLDHLLRHLGREPRIVVSPTLPESLRFLDPEGRIESFDPGGLHQDLAAWPDTWVLVDASEVQRLGGLEAAFRVSPARKLCLDHHLQEDPQGFDYAHIDSAAGASCELVTLLAVPRMAIPPEMARALWAGLMDDTGSFRFSSTSARGLRCAADLVEAGARPDEVYQALYHQGRPQRMKLFGRAFAAMRFLDGGRYAAMLVTQADLAACGAVKDDLEGLINRPLEIKGVEVSCLLQELGDGQVKVGLRSRGQVDVNAVCRLLGGGGHRLASGAKVDGPGKEAQNRVDQLVLSQMARDLPIR